MNNFLNELFWLNASTILHLPQDTTKERILDIVKRMKSGETDLEDLSPQLQKILEFYFTNIYILENV